MRKKPNEPESPLTFHDIVEKKYPICLSKVDNNDYPALIIEMVGMAGQTHRIADSATMAKICDCLMKAITRQEISQRLKKAVLVSRMYKSLEQSVDAEALYELDKLWDEIWGSDNG